MIHAVLVSALLAVAAVQRHPPAIPPLAPLPAWTPEQPQSDRYAFVASGGVSLGSYQAGVSYVFIADLMERRKLAIPTLLRRYPPPTLSIATGASAGNINV